MYLYCDTKSRILTVQQRVFKPCLNPASRRCDPMEACVQKTDILTAQKLMGHSTLEATMIYVYYQGGAKKVMKLLGNSLNDVDTRMGTAPKLRKVGGN